MTDSAEKDAPCECDTAYLGAQQAGTPLRCERCGRLVDADGRARLDAAYARSLRELEEWAEANPLRVLPPEES